MTRDQVEALVERLRDAAAPGSEHVPIHWKAIPGLFGATGIHIVLDPQVQTLPADLVVLSACTGGGGGFTGDVDPDDPIPDGLEAVFTAGDPSPGAMTLSLAPGSAAGEFFEVRVLVTGIDRFFGGAFHVEFDSASATFRDYSTAGSFIIADGVVTDFRAEMAPEEPDRLLVHATRQERARRAAPRRSQPCAISSSDAQAIDSLSAGLAGGAAKNCAPAATFFARRGTWILKGSANGLAAAPIKIAGGPSTSLPPANFASSRISFAIFRS